MHRQLLDSKKYFGYLKSYESIMEGIQIINIYLN